MLWVDRWKLHAYIPPGIEFSYCLQSVNQEFLQWSGRIPIWDTKRNQRVETKPSNRLYSVQQNTINGTFISAEIMCMWGVCVCVCVCWFVYTLSCSYTLASENFFRNTRHILPPFWTGAFTPTSLFLEHQFLKYSPRCFQVPAQMLPFRDTFYEHLRQTEPRVILLLLK